MNIYDRIIKDYPLVKKIECELNCYQIAHRRYLVFWDGLIDKALINEALRSLQEKTHNVKFSKFKTLIVVGKTNDHFKEEELFYFNNTDTFVVLYLINEKLSKIYMNASWIFALGLNYGKYVRRIHKICNKILYTEL